MVEKRRTCMAIDCMKDAQRSLDYELQDGSLITISVCNKCVVKFKGAKVSRRNVSDSNLKV
jgi:hypothetical protein